MKHLGYSWIGIVLLAGACSDGATLSGGSPDAGDADGGTAIDAALPDAGPDAATDASPNSPPTISVIADQTTQFPSVGPSAFIVDDAETDPSALVVTATSSDQAVLPDASIVLGGDTGTRTFTLTPIASGTAIVTITVNDGTTNAFENFTLSVTNAAPTAAADSFDAFGNTEIDVDAAAGVLANDVDDDGDTLTVIADNIVSGMGGVVTLAADGSFTYLPPVGVRDNVDSFDYQVNDGFVTSIGTASVSITNLVWYVDSTTAVSGDGRSSLPFETLTEVQAASGENDIIFVAGENYANGISLKDDQVLVGAPTGLTVEGTELIAPAAPRPIITSAAGDGVRFSARNEISGLAIENTAGDGISGSAITSALIDDMTFANTGGQAIDLGNTNPSGPVIVEITNTSIVGNPDLTDTIPVGIDVQVSGNGGGNAQITIDNNSIRQVVAGMLLQVEGSTGNGADGPNTITVTNNTITDFDNDGIQIEPNGTAVSSVVVSSNTLDGVDTIATATPDSGVDFRIQTDVGGNTALTMQNNQILDTVELSCVNLIGSGNNNGGDFTFLIQNNTLSNCAAEGLFVAPDDEVQFFGTVDGNTMTGNGAPSSFEFFTGTTRRLDLNLLGNEDDVGFQLERSTIGVLNLAGALGTGQSFDDDNGNISNNNNTTGGAAPIVTIVNEATPLQINIVDPATIATP